MTQDPDRPHLACVMGWPVMHSRSPLMHNFWMKQLAVRGSYVPLLIRPGTLEAALRALHPLGFSGANLTIPHKQDAIPVMDELDPVASLIGAISCVAVRPDGSLFGTNNDWRGFLGNVTQAAPDWTAKAGPATVIGAGGGARAVVHALKSVGATEIRLVNRTRARAERLAADLGGSITVADWANRADALDGAATVVNATSAGMAGQSVLDLPLDRLDPAALVADIIYTPLETPFLAAARARGNRTVNGLGMLLHQGPPAWDLWFGLKPAVTDDLRAEMERSLREGRV